MKTDSIWSELEAESGGLSERGTLKRRVRNQVACPMFFGIRHPGLKRTFIIQVPKELAPLPEAIPESKGFDYLVMIAGDEDRSDDISIMLSAAKPEYHDIFATICDDLVDKLSGFNNKRDVISAFLRRVRLWQLFFERQATEGLSIEAQKGLFGELYFLRDFVLPNCGGKNCLRYWMGAEGRQHDFQFGSLSVEVKTSAAKQHQLIHIASEQQLDESLVHELYLFILSVSLVENSEFTLPALVDEVRQIIARAEDDLDLFETILLARGYSEAHRSLYELTGYSIRRSACFHVRDQFPRITEADLRGGVGDVVYSISIDACAEYSVSTDALSSQLVDVMS